eukprot:3652212-Rhodomonas_salina.2
MQRLAVAFEAFTVDWTNPSTPTSDGVDEKVEGGVPLEGGRKVLPLPGGGESSARGVRAGGGSVVHVGAASRGRR